MTTNQLMPFGSVFKSLSLVLAAAVMTACVSEPVPETSSSSEVASSESSVVQSSEASSSSVAVSSSAAVSSSSVMMDSSSSMVMSSSSVSSSSLAPSSSSVASSSSSVSSTDVISSSSVASSIPALGEPNLVRGKELYDSADLGCKACHGADGTSTTFDAIVKPYDYVSGNSLEAMTQYIETDMPKLSGDPADCVGQCALDIAAYIVNGFDSGETGSSSSAAPGNAISAEAQAARVALGKQAYADNACGLCHRDDGETLVQFGSGVDLKSRSLKNCPSCDDYDSLVGAISATMPKGDNEFGPASCLGDCAKQTADYLWVEVIGGYLTDNGGALPVVTPVVGQDTLRVKSYDAIKADYVRVFGAVPDSLDGSAGAFRVTPDYWFEERSLGAVSLNVLANAAVEACGDEPMPAMTASAIRTKCGEWAERMWLRSATGEELDSCVDTATSITNGLSTTNKQLVFTCASMMISMPALTY